MLGPRHILLVLLLNIYLCCGATGNKMNGDAGAIDRRWDALMTNCKGCWSGSICWLDFHKENETDTFKITPRAENNKQNMRLAFSPRPSNAEIADWVVYHARALHERQEVTLYRQKEDDPMKGQKGPEQTFYCFGGGNLGRSGLKFGELPVIEHGYWDTEEGMRRTVVLAYDAVSGYISKVCFLQQKKQAEKEEDTFDVAAICLDHISVMPTRAQTLKKLKLSWKKNKGNVKEEILDCTKKDQYMDVHKTDTCNDSIGKLLGVGINEQVEHSIDDNVVRIALPNGVVIACPYYFKTGKDYEVIMGYRKKCGEIQMTEFAFDKKAKLQKVTARWIQKD